MTSANLELVRYGVRVWQEHGKLSPVLPPLERLVVEAWIKKEERRLWVLREVRAGRMIMIPLGWNYLSPEQQERMRMLDAGWKKVKSITITKLSIDELGAAYGLQSSPRTNVKRTT